MPSSKISQLTNAAEPIASDLHVLARGNANRNITTEDLFQDNLALSQFQAKITAGALIPGRWYQVRFCGPSGNRTVQVYATTNNDFSRRVVELTNTGPVIADWKDLTGVPAAITDNLANVCLVRDGFVSTSGTPALNINPWFGCFFDGGSSATLDGINNNTNLIDCAWRGQCGGNWDYVYGRNSYFNQTTLLNTCLGDTVLFDCRWDKSTVYKSNAGDNPWYVEMNNVQLSNASLYLEGGSDVVLYNCRFSNVTVTVKGGAYVDGLTIEGRVTDDELPIEYTIDGQFQARVVNNWAGYVLGDRLAGYSTVRLQMIKNDVAQLPGTYNTPNKSVNLLENSVVGVYLLPVNPTASTLQIQSINYANYYYWHAIELRQPSGAGGKYQHLFQNNFGTVTSSSDIVQYHGQTAKVGELLSAADFVRHRVTYSDIFGDLCWVTVSGCHYDQ